MTRLLLVRHAQTAWNNELRYMGHTDVPLNEIGRRQAAALARRLAHERPRAIFSSDLSRAWETALSIQSAIRSDCAPAAEPPLVAERRLREIDVGRWAGMTYAEIEAQNPVELKAWRSDRSQPALGGESRSQLDQRIQEVYNELVANYPEDTLIVVTHGGPTQVLVGFALGLPPERYWQLRADNTALSILNIYTEGTILNLFNDTCHLDLGKEE